MDLFSQIKKNIAPNTDFRDENAAPLTNSSSTVRIIAFYLPQFHPIKENDQNWGKGFTEWTNVTKALPRFSGHYQPRLPGELGFYDLRNVDVLKRQVELAKAYGIHGFCFHHYWFDGKSILRTPLDNLIASDIDLPFCINWANENWTRNWDGGTREIILSQNHSPEDDIAFINDLKKYISDRRYITVDGRPLIVIYRPDLLPYASDTVGRWRKELINSGFENPYIAACQSFQCDDPARFGMDAAVGFPPHHIGWQADDINASLEAVDDGFHGLVKDYSVMAANGCSVSREGYTYFHTVCPSWDNQARQANAGFCFLGASPQAYEDWLSHVCQRTLRELPPEKNFVFVNAWNEWAEGAYLEPDRHYGYAFLQSTANALNALQPKSSVFVESLNIGDEISWIPERLVQYHHWVGHIPFAFWLIKVCRPSVIVELGTHAGNSYCAFCQAIKSFDLGSRPFAIDEWRGDIHMSFDRSVLDALKAYHDRKYADFSTLMPMNFDHGRRLFSNNQIDLLHIDGTHTYEAVKHDFETWLPTLSSKGVVLFHDTQEHAPNFGVWKLWEELKQSYEGFEFTHSHGLGVLCVGDAAPEEVRRLCQLGKDESAADEIRNLFASKGERHTRQLTGF